MKKLPIGIQTFEKLITEGYLYQVKDGSRLIYADRFLTGLV